MYVPTLGRYARYGLYLSDISQNTMSNTLTLLDWSRTNMDTFCGAFFGDQIKHNQHEPN